MIVSIKERLGNVTKTIEHNIQAFTIVSGSTLAILLSGIWTNYWPIFLPIPVVAFFVGNRLESRREESKELRARIKRFEKLIGLFKKLLHSNYKYCFYSVMADLTSDDGEELQNWKDGYLEIHQVFVSWLNSFGISFSAYQTLVKDKEKLAVSIGEFSEINKHFFKYVNEFHEIAEKESQKEPRTNIMILLKSITIL